MGFAYGGWEYARVLVHPTGRVSVHVGTADHGQGHATSYAQIAADTLGLPPDDIDVVEGDTARVEFGQGTFNSRSLPVGGSAVHDCCEKVLAKARRIAAHMLKTAVEDVRYEAAVFNISQRARHCRHWCVMGSRRAGGALRPRYPGRPGTRAR